MHWTKEQFELKYKSYIELYKNYLQITHSSSSCQLPVCSPFSFWFIYYAFPTRFLGKNGFHQLQTKSKTIQQVENTSQ